MSAGFLEGFAGGLGNTATMGINPDSWLGKMGTANKQKLFGKEQVVEDDSIPEVPESPVGSDQLDAQFPEASKIANALGMLESSNNYNAVGPTVKGKNAYGKYQIMEQNIPSWSKEATGSEVSLQQFRSDKSLQDRIALYKIEAYRKQGYSPQDIASLWLSGRPLKGNQRKDLATGLSVPGYVERFNKYYQGT